MSLPNDTATRQMRALIAERNAWSESHPGHPYTLGRGAECLRRVLVADIEAGTLSPMPKKKASAPKKKPETKTDEGWLCSLEAMEVYRHIDVRRELGKCQAWASQNHAMVTRRRFVNWLNKAEKTIGYDARGKSSADSKKPKSNVPAGWLKVLERMYPDSVYFQRGGQFEITAESDHAWAQLAGSVRLELENEMRK